jgi:hypothetical protein
MLCPAMSGRHRSGPVVRGKCAAKFRPARSAAPGPAPPDRCPWQPPAASDRARIGPRPVRLATSGNAPVRRSPGRRPVPPRELVAPGSAAASPPPGRYRGLPEGLVSPSSYRGRRAWAADPGRPRPGRSRVAAGSGAAAARGPAPANRPPDSPGVHRRGPDRGRSRAGVPEGGNRMASRTPPRPAGPLLTVADVCQRAGHRQVDLLRLEGQGQRSPVLQAAQR